MRVAEPWAILRDNGLSPEFGKKTNGWCMYYVRLAEGGFRWAHSADGDVSLQIERRQLIWLLDGIDFEQPGAPRPVAAKVVL